MGKRKKVAYVVIKGHQTGIFDTWPEAEQQTKGFKGGAVYAGYTTREEAERAWDQQTIYPMPLVGNVSNYAFENPILSIAL